MASLEYFATCPKGLESLLLEEIKALGADAAKETVAGVTFSGDHSFVYQVCLWSRLANKVLLPIATVDADDEKDLYKAVAALPWDQHFHSHNTFKVDFVGTNRTIRNTQFGAVRVKDGIVDRFQILEDQRPSVDRENPDIIINVRLHRGKAQISLDLAGESLHRRGYRGRQGAAPLKENLAVAILLRAGWPALAEEGGYLIDPMCGSATFLIEAVMLAADIAPGLLRVNRRDMQWGFTHWKFFDYEAWNGCLSDAKKRRQQGLEKLRKQGAEYRGYDADWRVLQAAMANIETAGLQEFVRVLERPIENFTKPTHKPMHKGLVICNPPYGERLGEEEDLMPLYKTLGDVLKTQFVNWQAAIITSNTELAKKVGISARKKYKFYNGKLLAELLLFNINEENFYTPHLNKVVKPAALSDGAKMVANRLKKNQKALKKWLASESIDAYRLYDADLPEYAAAIDIYGDAVHIQEYAAPKTVDEKKARQRFDDLVHATRDVLGFEEDQLFIKQRRKTSGKSQYEAQHSKNRFAKDKSDAPQRDYLKVQEYKATFLIDLWSYLDTGLFLDHRPVRRLISDKVAGKSFLNLFCYTATATVHAALAGASQTTSVDMSKTYLAWAQQNFDENHLSPYRHEVVQEDCLKWLANCRQGYDVIFLDPPSFSNSKRMQSVLDIQRDHVQLIQRCMEILNKGGTLIFSNNLRSFKMDQSLADKYQLDNISEKTLDPDFKRNKKIHHCWLIRAK